MSALDPSAPGLPLAMGGGSVASTDITDSTSTGRALLTATNDIAAAAIINGARRWAADAGTLLLWELNEASGDFANSGSLGAAGDLHIHRKPL